MAPGPESSPERPEPQAVSLSELTEAFAQAMGVRPESEPAPVPADSAAEAEPQAAGALAQEAARPPAQVDGPPPGLEQDAGPEQDACPISPRTILEAMLFVGSRDNQPLSSARAAELMRGVEPEEIPTLVDELNRRYVAAGCPYQVVHQGSGYRMTLRKAYHPVRNRLYGRIREARLSQAAIDVLAIVAYQQPIAGEEVGRQRGRPSSHVLAQLVRRGLLRVQREDPKRRGAQYLTTDRFLDLFGLHSLADLPRSEDLERR